MVATACSICFSGTHNREIGRYFCLSVSSSFLNRAETLAFFHELYDSHPLFSLIFFFRYIAMQYGNVDSARSNGVKVNITTRLATDRKIVCQIFTSNRKVCLKDPRFLLIRCFNIPI